MTLNQNTDRRRRRIVAAVAGWALIGAVSTGIVVRTNADEIEPTASPATVTTTTGTTPSTSTTPTSSSAPSSSTAATSTSTEAATSSTAAASSSTAATSSSTAAASSSTYADGSYTATGSYRTPGGTESITITLTVANDVITAASATGDASSPPSSQYQEDFVDNFASLIIGKSIDEVSLDKVSGSSLTADGFNAAVETIKTDALA